MALLLQVRVEVFGEAPHVVRCARPVAHACEDCLCDVSGRTMPLRQQLVDLEQVEPRQSTRSDCIVTCVMMRAASASALLAHSRSCIGSVHMRRHNMVQTITDLERHPVRCRFPRRPAQRQAAQRSPWLLRNGERKYAPCAHDSHVPSRGRVTLAQIRSARAMAAVQSPASSEQLERHMDSTSWQHQPFERNNVERAT